MIKDKEGNNYLINQQGNATILNNKGKVIQQDFMMEIKVDPNGNRYIEMEGKKYHANSY